MNRISPVAELNRGPEKVLFRQSEYVYSD
jgi:hypothetical protein